MLATKVYVPDIGLGSVVLMEINFCGTIYLKYAPRYVVLFVPWNSCCMLHSYEYRESVVLVHVFPTVVFGLQER